MEIFKIKPKKSGIDQHMSVWEKISLLCIYSKGVQ